MENLEDGTPQGGDTDIKQEVAKAKPTPKRKGRKAVKKKPDDMPRRPLSAYNFFFSEMRTKLLADRTAGNDSAFQKFLDERKEQEGEKKNGFFSNMGKFVAKRWKELTPDELVPYTEKAEKDLQRYRREMDEYREGVARKTRLASEQKLRMQEAEAAKAPQMPPNANQSGQVGLAAANPWMMGAAGGNPMMGFQNPADPSFQLLLRQQLLQAQNPQFNAFFLQQQLGGGMPGGSGGMMGFPGMGQYDQAALMGQQGGGGQQGAQQGSVQGVQPNQDVSSQQQGQQQQPGGAGGGQQQYSDMQQNQQELLNSLQQQNRMQGMYSGMIPQGQFGMPMGMAGMGGGMAGMGGGMPGMGGGMPGQDGSGGGNGGGMDQMAAQQMQMGQQQGGNLQGQGGASAGQW